MSFELGWYYIDEVWNLYVDGDLTETHVDFLEVDEKANGDGYVANHFDRAGELITSLTLDEGDLEDVLGDKEPTDRPMHI